MVLIKVTSGADIRRIQVNDATELTYDALVALLRKIYVSLPARIEIKYLDDENDHVTISSDRELSDALDFVRTSIRQPQVLRLTIFDASTKKVVEEKLKEKEADAPASASTSSASAADAFNPVQLIELIENAMRSPEVQQTLGTVQETLSTCVEQAVREGRTAAHYVQQHPQFTRAQRLLTERIPQAIQNDLNTTIPQLVSEIQGIFSNLSRPQQTSASTSAASSSIPAPPPASSSSSSEVVHHAYCDSCQEAIVGIRYKCTTCVDYDLCENCEAKPGVHDPAHYFLKLRTQLPWTMEHARLLQPTRPTSPLYRASRCPYIQQLPQDKPRQECHGRRSSACGRSLSARFVADMSVEDGTVVLPNTSFLKVWRLRNDGDRAWPEGTTLTHIFGPALGNVTSVPVPALPVNEETDVAVAMTAPSEPGRYVSNWRLAGPRGYKFGHRVWADITVQSVPEKTEQPAEPATNTEVPAGEAEEEEFEVIEKEEQPKAVIPEPVPEQPKPEESVVAQPEPTPVPAVEPTPAPVTTEPVSVPQPRQDDEPEHVRIILDQLQQMGFLDRARNKRVLARNRGDVLRTVHQLLDQ